MTDMGIELVGLTLQPEWAKLSNAPRIILVAMALHARDKPTKRIPAAVYFGGHKLLCLAYYGAVPNGPEDPDYGPRLRQIRYYVDLLEKAGAIQTYGRDRYQGNFQYRLTLGGPDGPPATP